MIRPARPEDAGAIAAIWNIVIRETTHTFTTTEKAAAPVAAAIAAGTPYWVAGRGDEVLGFATYSQFRGGNGYAHAMEHSVHLAPEAQGKGLGRALMARLEDHAARAGVHVMVAGVSGDNPGGIAFHAALGYVEVGRMPEVGRKWDRWLDLVLMQKILLGTRDPS